MSYGKLNNDYHNSVSRRRGIKTATDYIMVTLTLTFLSGLIFMILGLFSDEWPRPVVFYMLSSLGWLGTFFLLLLSAEEAILGIAYLFLFLFIICWILVILEAMNWVKIFRKQKRGYD